MANREDYLKLPGTGNNRRFYNDKTGEVISYRQYRNLFYSKNRQKRAKIWRSMLDRKYGEEVSLRNIYTRPDFIVFEHELASKDDKQINRALNKLRNHPISMDEEKTDYEWIA